MCVCVCVCEVAQSCPTLCDPVDCSPPGSTVHGILQARILEWVAISFSMGSSQPRDRTWVSLLHCRQTLYPLSHQGSHREALETINGSLKYQNQVYTQCLGQCSFYSSPLPPYLSSALFWGVVYLLKIWKISYSNSRLDDLVWENTTGHSDLSFRQQKPELCPFYFPCLSLIESLITKHQYTFPVQIVTQSSHHRP